MIIWRSIFHRKMIFLTISAYSKTQLSLLIAQNTFFSVLRSLVLYMKIITHFICSCILPTIRSTCARRWAYQHIKQLKVIKILRVIFHGAIDKGHVMGSVLGHWDPHIAERWASWTTTVGIGGWSLNSLYISDTTTALLLLNIHETTTALGGSTAILEGIEHLGRLKSTLFIVQNILVLIILLIGAALSTISNLLLWSWIGCWSGNSSSMTGSLELLLLYGIRCWRSHLCEGSSVGLVRIY